MSGNIHDTKTIRLKDDVGKLKTELDDLLANGEKIDEWESTLRTKYKYICSTSESLFKMIVSSYGTSRFNKDFFENTLNMMLQKIEDIQSSKISQHNASHNVGEHLASNFIPQLRK